MGAPYLACCWRDVGFHCSHPGLLTGSESRYGPPRHSLRRWSGNPNLSRLVHSGHVVSSSASMIQTLFGSLEEPEKKSIFGRMKEAVSRTPETLADRIEGIVALTHEVDEAALEELE